MFKLDKRLAADTIEIGEMELCKVLLMNDRKYPWVILVPKVASVTEIFELAASQQNLLKQESNQVLKLLSEEFKADKMNVAALGNVVSQLHIHHIVRYKTDNAWPAPVWGHSPVEKYSKRELTKIVMRLQELLIT